MGLYPFIWSSSQLSGGGGGGSSLGFGIFQTPLGTFPSADTPNDFVSFTSSDSSLAITGNSGTTTIDFAHAASGATAGTYGSATKSAVVTVNAAGHVTSISEVSISVGGAVSSVFGRTGAVVATSGDYTTAQVTESGSLYFTNARAIAATLTGYTSGTGTISSSDSILQSIQKLNGNIAAIPLSNYVLKAGDTMTGTLVSPKVSFTNTLDSSTMDVGWAPLNNRYEVYIPDYGIDINATSVSGTVESSYFQLSRSAFNAYANGGGIILSDASNGAYVEVSGGGSVNITANPTSDYNIIGNYGNLNFGANGGDFSINNGTFGSPAFIAYNGGQVYIQALNSQPIRLINGAAAKTIVSNGFEITNDSAVTQAFLLAYEGRNLAFGQSIFGGGITSGAVDNIAIGTRVLQSNLPSGASGNIGIGTDVFSLGSLTPNATSNIGIGSNALTNLTDGSANIAIGTNALSNVTTAQNNLGFGTAALEGVTTGAQNTAIGAGAGRFTTTGTNNLFIGVGSGLFNTTGAGNTYIGESSGAQVNGNGNIAIGPGAMAGAASSTASGNVVIGSNLLPSISTGAYNINIGIGNGSSGVITTGSKNIIIGFDSDVPSGTANNQMSIGNYMYGANFSTQVGSTISDAFLGLGVKLPSARLHLTSGQAGASKAPLKFTSGTNLTTPESGAVEFDGTNFYITGSALLRRSLVGTVFTQTADKTVTNTVTETSIIGTGVGTATLPANFFVAGRTIRLRIGGVYSTPSLATPSLVIKVKLGSTVIATVTTSALLSGATNLEFDGEVLITCRTTGASGTVMVHGDIEYATGVAGTISVDPLNNAGATTTVDTTASKLLDVTVTWDTATATRIAKSTITSLEVLN